MWDGWERVAGVGVGGDSEAAVGWRATGKDTVARARTYCHRHYCGRRGSAPVRCGGLPGCRLEDLSMAMAATSRESIVAIQTSYVATFTAWHKSHVTQVHSTQ